MDELDIPPGKVERVGATDRRPRGGRVAPAGPCRAGPEHLFLAFAQVEWDLFAEVMRELNLNPYAILQTLDDHLLAIPSAGGRDVHPSAGGEARVQAGAAACEPQRPAGIDSGDLFTAIFEETQGVPVSLLRGSGRRAGSAGRTHLQPHDVEIRDERLKKRFELPPFRPALRDEPEPARPSGIARCWSSAATVRSSKSWRFSAIANARTR